MFFIFTASATFEDFQIRPHEGRDSLAVNLGGKENKPTLAFCSQLLSGAIYQVQKDLEQMVQQQVEPGR